MPLAKAVQLLKGSSSRWMNETHPNGFAWQEGYGAFTLGVSQKPRTIDYIKRQAEHHLKRSFEEEFLAFLKKHAIDYDPKFVWGRFQMQPRKWSKHLRAEALRVDGALLQGQGPAPPKTRFVQQPVQALRGGSQPGDKLPGRSRKIPAG